MAYTLTKYIAEFGYILLFLAIVVYFFGLKRVNEKPYRLFTLYLFVIGIIQILSEVYKGINGGNLFLTHYYFIIQSVLLSSFYYAIIESPKVKKLIKIIVSFTIISLVIQYYFYPELYHVFNVYEIFICIIPLVMYALSHLFQTLGDSNKKYIYITSGALIYFLPHALVFSSGNLMPGLPENVNQLVWVINAALYLVFLILILLEWHKHFRKETFE
jgi:hypothetical protein